MYGICKRVDLLCSEVWVQCTVVSRLAMICHLTDDESEDEIDIDDNDEHEVRELSLIHI